MNNFSTNRNDKKTVVVYGGLGRIGLPLSLFLGESFLVKKVYAIDLDLEKCQLMNSGTAIDQLPKEEGIEDYYMSNVCVKEKVFFDVHKPEYIKEADAIIIMVGTHLDEYGHTDYSAIDAVFDKITEENLSGKDVFLRSTVEVGTTFHLAEKFRRVGNKPKNLFYWPERVMEGVALREFHKFPQIIGTSPIRSDENMDFNYLFGDNNYSLKFVTSKEAEFIKVATNMSRYAHFAMANELMMAAEKNGLDFSKISHVMKDNYERMGWFPSPGPNVGGPCLSKDYQYLKPVMKEPNMFSHADVVNNDVVKFVADKLKGCAKILILGTTFKPESDNIRGSKSFELRDKILRNERFADVFFFDPYVRFVEGEENNYFTNFPTTDILSNMDAFVVMTPHNWFMKNNIYQKIIKHGREDALMVDYWRGMNNYAPNRPYGYINKLGDLR